MNKEITTIPPLIMDKEITNDIAIPKDIPKDLEPQVPNLQVTETVV
jgi:hypothetical protein